MKNLSMFLVVVLVTFLTNCQTTPTQSGAMGGAVLGGVAGQLLGGNTESTLIGAGAGALLGGLANDAYQTKKQQTYQQGYNDALQQREYREFQEWRQSQGQGYGQQPSNYYPSSGGYYQTAPVYYSQPYYHSYPSYYSHYPSSNSISLSYASSKSYYNTSPRSDRRSFDYGYGSYSGYGSGVPGDEYMRRTDSGEWITKGSVNGNYHPGDDLSHYVSPNTRIYKHQVRR